MTEAQFPYAIKLTVDVSSADASIQGIERLLDGVQTKADSINFAQMGTAIKSLSEGSQGLSTVADSLISIAGALGQMSAAAPGITSVAGSLTAIKTTAGPAATSSTSAFGQIGEAANAAADRVSRLEIAIGRAITRAQGLGGVGVIAPVGAYQPTSAGIVQAAGYTTGGRAGTQAYGTGVLGPIAGSAVIEDVAGRLRELGKESMVLPVRPQGARDYPASVQQIWPSMPRQIQSFLGGFYEYPPGEGRPSASYSPYTREIGSPTSGASQATLAHETGHVAVDMLSRLSTLPGEEQTLADLGGLIGSGRGASYRASTAGGVLTGRYGRLGGYFDYLRSHYAGSEQQSEEMVASILGSRLTGVDTLPGAPAGASPLAHAFGPVAAHRAGQSIGGAGLLSELFDMSPVQRLLGRFRGLSDADVGILAGIAPRDIGLRRAAAPSARAGYWSDMPEMDTGMGFEQQGFARQQGIFQRGGRYQFPMPGARAGFGPTYPTYYQAHEAYYTARGWQPQPAGWAGTTGAQPPPPTVPPWPGTAAAPPSLPSLAWPAGTTAQPSVSPPPSWPGTTAAPPPPYWAAPPPAGPPPGITSVRPPWPHGFAGVTQARYQEVWAQAGQELGAIQQAYPGMVDVGPDMARIMSFEPSRRGGPRDIGVVAGPAAQIQRTQQLQASTSAMDDFGRSIARTAGYFLRWLIVWNVFEFVMNGLRSMVVEATALEDIIARVAFIQGVPSGQARDYVLDQYGAGAQYGMMPSQTRGALPAAAAYGIDVAAGGQMRRAFGIEPAAGIQGLQEAMYQTGAQIDEIQNVMAILYREAPNQAAQLLEVVGGAGLLSRQIGVSWEEIAYATMLTSRQMGKPPSDVIAPMARFAMRVPESMSTQIIQELARMDDPAMLERMGESGLGVTTRRGGIAGLIMVEMIRNLNQAMEDGIEPGEAFADLLQSVADTPTEAFVTAKAAMAVAWTDAVAAADEATGATTLATLFLEDLAIGIGALAEGGPGKFEQEIRRRWNEEYGFGPAIKPQDETYRGPRGGTGREVLPDTARFEYPRRRETYDPTPAVTPQWQVDITQDPLKYIGGMRQYGDLSQEEFAGRIGERMPEFERMLEQIIQMTPGTAEQRATMRTRITGGFATGGGWTGFQGGEVGTITGKEEAAARWLQSAYPEELRETPFKTLGDVTEAEFMRMLPRAQEWEREAEDIFGREFEEVKMDVAFEDSFKELTMSQEALAKTMELLNDTMTGMWNIPAGQMPMIPMPRGIDIVTGDGLAAGAVAGGGLTAGTIGEQLRGYESLDLGTVGAQVGRYTSRAAPPLGTVNVPTPEEVFFGTHEGPQPMSRPATGIPQYGGYGGRQAATAPIVVNMTAYLKVDGRQIVTQVERIMIQDARVTMRSVA